MCSWDIVSYTLCLECFTLLSLCNFHVNVNYYACKCLLQQNYFSEDSGLDVPKFTKLFLTDACHDFDLKFFKEGDLVFVCLRVSIYVITYVTSKYSYVLLLFFFFLI